MNSLKALRNLGFAAAAGATALPAPSSAMDYCPATKLFTTCGAPPPEGTPEAQQTYQACVNEQEAGECDYICEEKYGDVHFGTCMGYVIGSGSCSDIHGYEGTTENGCDPEEELYYVTYLDCECEPLILGS